MLLPVSVAALLLCLCPVSQSLDYCVVPDAGDCDDCPLLLNNAPCNTLQYYANNSNFTSNSIFHFLEGEHALNTIVVVTNVANLTLVGVGPHQNLNRVECAGKPNARFVVEDFANFTVQNLSFHKCGEPHSAAALYLLRGSGLSIDRITENGPSGILLESPSKEHSSISNSRFGIVYFFAHYCSDGPIHISINNCEIMHELALMFECPHVLVHLTNSVVGSYGAGNPLLFGFPVLTGNFVRMNNITISNSHEVGVIIAVGVTFLSCELNTLQPHNLMEISNVTITNNTGRFAFNYENFLPQNCNGQNIVIRDSVITDQLGKTVVGFAFGSQGLSQVIFKNVTFSSITPKYYLTTTFLSTTYFVGMLKVIFIDCTFENNQMTAILAVRSNLIFQGNNTFRNNSAVNGAGIMLVQNSYLNLHNNTNITFADNHATEKGGAMYIDGERNLQGAAAGIKCNILYNMEDKKQIHFLNNTAGRAGSALYWMTGDYCRGDHKSYDNSIKSLLQPISNLQNTESDPSAISSDPIRICQCLARHHMPNCSSAFPPIRAYPGEDFPLRLAVVGTMNGTVPGTIYAEFPQTPPPAILGDLQDTQHNEYANCNDVTYTVYSSNRSAYFYLTATEYSQILNISVDLKPCPIGFALDNDACKCDKVIGREGINCFINNQSILRPANTWMGFSTCLDNSSETGVVFSEHCPHGYCLPRDVYLSADDPDIQCADNRTGVLCGQCVKNYSLTLGSQKCSECSNLYLLLLFPLATSGLVLVAVLFVLNLTVTEGSINGLIFYANVISMSQYSGTSSQLYTFIAWLNLDLGIDTCFYDGMDAYTETWLQFAFPLFLWLIIAAIIVVCNIFPKLTERGTQNAVKVLATLLLLSYTKLQRMLVTIFSFTTLRYPSGAVHYVWLYDANVHFLQGKHVYLFIAGVLVLGLLVLPYTFGLALFQYLQACSGRRVCRWVNKLKPVFDAYAGPYKDRYRMWTGLLLVTRTFLIILFSLNEIITGSPDFNHFVTLITSQALLLFSTRRIYRKWPCDILEALFYVQLGVFSGGALYASLSNGSVSAVADFSFATTLLVFLVVVSYHAFSSFRKIICCRKDEEALDPEEEEQLLFRERERLDPSLVLSHPCKAASKSD